METVLHRFADIVVDFPRKIVLSDRHGKYTADQLMNTAVRVYDELLEQKNLRGKQIAVLMPPGLSYAATMLGGWMSGAMMVPLCIDHPAEELEHVIKDSKAALILCHKELKSKLPSTPVKIILWQKDVPAAFFSPHNAAYPEPSEHALMLYTSGTTGKPKGVVHTHASLAAQVKCLIEAWEWTEDDRILHFLPLHHTHGIVNKWLCALWAGARCDFIPKFETAVVTEKLKQDAYTLFMAVPTVYSKLIQYYDEHLDIDTHQLFQSFRLMVSGSAALSVNVLNQWKTLSGHVLLERYGMTEIGMALSNPYRGERKPGFVGTPLPGMQVRLRDDEGKLITEEGIPGELEVQGSNVFKEYWNKPEETRSGFTKDGWFKTGDLAVFEEGAYRIIGRISTDIIKCGGYKISALEIENVLQTHPSVAEIAVAGVADETWGERIGAWIVLKPSATLTLDELRSFGATHLASYKLPTLIYITNELPRNAMGKVMKKSLKPVD